ncbi:HST2 [Sanghuangporus weigelae]
MWRFLSNDDVPQFLDSLDLPGVAKYIKSESCKNIFVMAGAGLQLIANLFTCNTTLNEFCGIGISTSAGIPDFRSPDTGLYANLARLNLPYPEAVFDISFFKRNPRPFYVLAHELAPGRFRPTLTHSFIKLLADKELLHTCFTQNIDTLERAAGVPPEKIIEAHGSFANQHCVECGASYPEDKIKKKIDEQEIPICEKPGCGGFVKPDIVFFGESMPPNFFRRLGYLKDADLLIVLGTSLTVHPFASLAELVPEECPRLLVNLDHVGGWGSRSNDVACLMPVDNAMRQLCSLLGWEEELDALWAATDMTMKNRIEPSAVTAKEPAENREEEPEERKKVEEKQKKVAEAKEEEARKATEEKERKEVIEVEEETHKAREEEGAREDKNRKEVEVVEEEETPEAREVEEEPKEKEEPSTADDKNVDEEMLANLVDKLAETISRVRLEQEIETGDGDQAKPDADEGDSTRPEGKSTSDNADDPSDESVGTKEPKDSSVQGQESSTTSSLQTGKL